MIAPASSRPIRHQKTQLPTAKTSAKDCAHHDIPCRVLLAASLRRSSRRQRTTRDTKSKSRTTSASQGCCMTAWSQFLRYARSGRPYRRRGTQRGWHLTTPRGCANGVKVCTVTGSPVVEEHSRRASSCGRRPVSRNTAPMGGPSRSAPGLRTGWKSWTDPAGSPTEGRVHACLAIPREMRCTKLCYPAQHPGSAGGRARGPLSPIHPHGPAQAAGQ